MRWTVGLLAAMLGCSERAVGEGGTSAAGSTGEALGCPAPDDGLDALPRSQAASTMAAFACMAWVGCDCEDRSHETVDSCRHAWNMEYESLVAGADLFGLAHDGVCLAQHVADLQALGCDGTPAEQAWSVIGPGRCAVFHGTVAVDGSCTAIGGGLSDCAQGLACWNGRCADPCSVTAAGERCGQLFGFACAPGIACAAQGCGPPIADVGEACDGTSCVASAWCRIECPSECQSICVPRRIDGSPCANDQECTSDECVDGLCAAAPVAPEAVVCALAD